MGEETEDSLRDRAWNVVVLVVTNRYDHVPKAPNTKKFGTGKTMEAEEMEKKYGKGKSAMDIVRADITASMVKAASWIKIGTLPKVAQGSSDLLFLWL